MGTWPPIILSVAPGSRAAGEVQSLGRIRRPPLEEHTQDTTLQQHRYVSWRRMGTPCCTILYSTLGFRSQAGVHSFMVTQYHEPSTTYEVAYEKYPSRNHTYMYRESLC